MPGSRASKKQKQSSCLTLSSGRCGCRDSAGNKGKHGIRECLAEEFAKHGVSAPFGPRSPFRCIAPICATGWCFQPFLLETRVFSAFGGQHPLRKSCTGSVRLPDEGIRGQAEARLNSLGKSGRQDRNDEPRIAGFLTGRPLCREAADFPKGWQIRQLALPPGFQTPLVPENAGRRLARLLLGARCRTELGSAPGKKIREKQK